MSDLIPNSPSPGGEFLLYQTEDGRTRLEVRFDGETAWLTQAAMAELFQTTPQNITLNFSGLSPLESQNAELVGKYVPVRVTRAGPHSLTGESVN